MRKTTHRIHFMPGQFRTAEQDELNMQADIAAGERRYREQMLEDPWKPWELEFEPEDPLFDERPQSHHP